GVIILEPSSVAICFMQFRPEFQKTPTLFDVTVRRAMASSIDRQSLNEAIFDGEGTPTDTVITKDYRYFDEMDRAGRWWRAPASRPASSGAAPRRSRRDGQLFTS